MAIVDLTPAARRLSELVRHIDDDQLSAPTPSDIPVAGMLDHVGGLAVAFAAAATKDLGSVTATRPAPDGDRLGTAWRGEIPRALTALAQAWTDPAAWEGMTQVGGVTLPGEIAGQIALDEVVLHAWDLARGTGQPYQQDPATLEACLAAMTSMYPPDDLDARKGIFEPPVPVPDNAPLVDRVVAYSGPEPAGMPEVVGKSGRRPRRRGRCCPGRPPRPAVPATSPHLPRRRSMHSQALPESGTTEELKATRQR
jgi:uncharacterized protein (TIGR03086 family)